MATFARRRLLQDLQKLRKNVNFGIEAMPNDDNIFLWDAYI
jgi:ubiquitin-protein ligase